MNRFDCTKVNTTIGSGYAVLTRSIKDFRKLSGLRLLEYALGG